MSAPLFERFRPRTWDEVVGQNEIVNTIKRLRAKAGTLGGRAYFISGKSGQGKTSIARLIAGELAEPLFINEMNAGQLTTGDLDAIEKGLRYKGGWGNGQKTGKVWILNECQAIGRKSLERLLTLLEHADTDGLPEWVCFIFTTTIEGKQNLFEEYDDASPLLSRCFPLVLAQRGVAEAFALRAQTIAKAEGLDGRPLKDYLRLVNEHRGNLRAVLNAIETGAMSKAEGGAA